MASETDDSEPNADARAYWNGETTRIWSSQDVPMDKMFAGFTRDILDLAGPGPGEQVIDIGCATGTTLLDLARRVGPGGAVLGVDIAERSIGRARARLGEAGLKQGDAVAGDATTYQFVPQFFDLAFSRFGVMFFQDPAASFSNIAKALKPGGRLALIVWRSAAENVWATGAVEAVRHLLPPQPLVAPGYQPGQFGWSDPGIVRQFLGKAGFADIRFTPHDPEIRLAGAGASEAADGTMRVGAAARATETASPSEREAVRAGIEAYFRDHEGEDGIVLPGALWLVEARRDA